VMPLSAAFKTSLREATSRYHAALDQRTIGYLASRGIGLELAEHFQLGLVAEPAPGHEHFRGRLSIPFLGAADDVLGMRFRSLSMEDGPKYLGLPGITARLFNVRCLHDAALSTVCITEGEIDAISLAAAGIQGVGVCGADAWKRHHPRLFAGFDRVVVLGDGDDAGRKFSRKVSGSIQSAIEIVLPEGADINSVLVAGGPEAVKELVGI
jgi:DNA primase